MTSPLDFGAALTAELIPFTAGDGVALNLIHVTGIEPASRRPVLLVHGAGVRANIFNPPVPMTLVRYLVERGHDVWLENWRASIDLPRSEWTLDQAAVHDHPAAVRKVCELTGANSCAAIIHCQGSTSFMMAALSGLLPQVDLIISNAVALYTQIPDDARIKLLYLVPLVAKMTPYLDPRWGEKASGVIPRLLQSWVRLRHRECDNGVCQFSSFTYGAGHPTLWRHENISEQVHDWIRGEFADVPLSFFLQMRRSVKHGNLLATGSEPAMLTDLTAIPIKTQARFVLLAGAKNECFSAASQKQTYQWLEQQHSGRHALHVIPDYGHLDVFIGKNAYRDVFPIISQTLELQA